MAVAAFVLGSVLVSGVLSRTVSYPDLTPRLSSEIKDLINEVLEHGRGKQTYESQIQAVEIEGWGHTLPRLGQISGVSVDEQGRPVIFHRGPTKWLSRSFNESFIFQEQSQGPIPVDTVLTLDPQSGMIESSWGRNIFYMPHGITICTHTGDIWLTDVALHQVFKYESGQEEPSFVLGVAFEPGSDDGHLCQPTSVAVASTGDVFVADGYCNSRIMRFTSDGVFVNEMGSGMGELRLTLPHGITLLEERDAVCVADRETRRLVCLKAGLSQDAHDQGGDVLGEFQDPAMGRTFGIASYGGLLFVVAGQTDDTENMGLTIDPVAGKILDEWAPKRGFKAPHAVAVSPDAGEIYVSEIGPNRIHKFVLV
ncbi:peptidyl-alpha-hydroxyglycine alpha-amidating lyase 2-like [Neocloeon triangulifer]|uniref:peptidyl-alpha-hydroxyglycine alpha-amidating lyase 2-like n=1 Tax=Neocloeon triangulifer TaxID=2078957 RepID=UPI00286F2694|nr:peptidyl-alpha-hydroxyglycine alpha-amidating lyase 2-like [Neocloeon triangulifer]